MIRVLGPVSVEGAEGRPEPLSPTLRILLALLVAHRGTVVSTDRLRDALWGDEQPQTAVVTVQSHLSRLRRLLAPGADIVGVERGYRLELPDGHVDVDHFQRCVDEARRAPDAARAASCYSEALSWWRGEAFGDVRDHQHVQAFAVRLDELRQAATEAWIDRRMAVGGDPAIIADLEELIATHPLREQYWRALMIALVDAGRKPEALRRAAELRRLLRDELGLDPSPAARELEQQILVDDPSLSGRVVALTGGRAAPVLDDPTRLIGRDELLRDLRSAVHEIHLLTLVGPGGVGKTRLARRLAATLDGFAHGAVMVELAAVDEPGALVNAVATALDVQQRQHLSVEDTLLAVLGERHQVVVLDNCEHVLDTVVPLVERMRTRCPRVHVVATSREPLGLSGEVLFTVAPLAVVPPGVGDLKGVAGFPAVELLVDRARAVVPGFALTDANASSIAELCRRLDGLPLALELAGARFRSLTPETILDRFAERSLVLGAGSRTSDARHRSLRDTIGWSYELLGADERALFEQLSVFSGSFDVAAAEAVCCPEGPVPATGDATDASEVLDLLAALVDKSMVQLVDRDANRYQMLETLREFGREKLAAHDAGGRVDDAHLRWFLHLAERAGKGLAGPEEAAWSGQLDRDFDNLRAAHARAVRTGDVDAALRIVAGLREYAFRRIRYELTSWAATTVQMPDAPGHPRYPVVLSIVAYGHFVRGDLDLCLETGRRAVAAQEAFGSESSGLAERALGNALFYLGRTDEALAWMDQMVASARDGSPARLAHALYMRSVAETSVGRKVRGAILAGEAQAAARASGSPTALAQAAYALGLSLEGSEPDESLCLLRHAAATAAAAGNRWIEAFAQTEVWWLEARTGEARTALAGLADVIDTWHRGGDWANLRLSLRHVLGILRQVGDHQGAAVLHGALSAAGAHSALPFEPSDAEQLAEAVAQLSTELAADSFHSAVNHGAALSGDALVAFLHERVAGLVQPSPPGRARTSAPGQ
jgi:predicted ATPase/DNA-binding SARP family transcriptional activator